MNSPEYQTMVSTTVMLTETFAMDIMSVGAAFWQEGMIPPGVNDIINSRIKEPKEKSRELVSALTTKVRTSKKCFRQVVCVIIDQGDWAKNLLESMKKKYEGCGGKDFPHKCPKRKACTSVQPDQMEQNHNNNEVNQQPSLLEESTIENKPTSSPGRWKMALVIVSVLIVIIIILSWFSKPTFKGLYTRLSVSEEFTHSLEKSEYGNGKDLKPYMTYPQQNLPTSKSPFFGRAEDLKRLKDLIVLNSARVINIYGPPAFGKSRLAIQLGHQLLEYHPDVVQTIRYINTEATRSSWYLCQSVSDATQKEEFDSFSEIHALSDKFVNRADNASKNEQSNLCEWSKRLKRRTVLILDNCDDTLHSHNREKFLDIIQGYFSNSMITVVITSQEKLAFLGDGFVSIKLGELTPGDSRAMLLYNSLGLTAKEADKLASAVGHCPLALKVVTKLLLERGYDYLDSLLNELKENVIDTISDWPTRNEEKFVALMHIAYNQMDTQTQECARYLSLFQGSVAYQIEMNILAPIVESSCIKDVIRHSFVDETFVNGKSRHQMHKLIQTYFKSDSLDPPIHSEEQYQFNISFVRHYSTYLISVMKQLYNDNEIVTDEQLYTYIYLETHNLKQFENMALFIYDCKNVTVEMRIRSSLALGLLIQENITNSYTVQQETVVNTYSSFKNVSVFANLCAISSPKVCARIFWKIITNLSIPKCLILSSHFDFLQDQGIHIPNWIVVFLSCPSLCTCAYLETFRYEDTLEIVYNNIIKPAVNNITTTNENNLYHIIKQRVTICSVYDSYMWYLLTAVVNNIAPVTILVFLFTYFKKVFLCLPLIILTYLLASLFIYLLTPKIQSTTSQLTFAFPFLELYYEHFTFDLDEGTTNACNYEYYYIYFSFRLLPWLLVFFLTFFSVSLLYRLIIFITIIAFISPIYDLLTTDFDMHIQCQIHPLNFFFFVLIWFVFNTVVVYLILTMFTPYQQQTNYRYRCNCKFCLIFFWELVLGIAVIVIITTYIFNTFGTIFYFFSSNIARPSVTDKNNAISSAFSS